MASFWPQNSCSDGIDIIKEEAKKFAPPSETQPSSVPFLDKQEKGSGSKSIYAEEPSELFSLIRKKNWSDVVKRSWEFPAEASTWVVEKNLDGSVRWRLLPLHQACESHPSEAAIRAILTAYPKAVTMKDSGGDLPIHVACRERADVSVIDNLLMEYPEGARVTDDEGRLPLHLACRQRAEVEAVRHLLVAYHHGAQCPDTYGLLPVHWACAQNSSLGVVETLLRAFPECNEVRDKWGRTPLALASSGTGERTEDIVDALQRDPSHWTTELINRVNTLERELLVTKKSEKEITCRAESLESKLMEVTATSSAAAKTFRDLKEALQAENHLLKKRLKALTLQNEEKEQQIGELQQDNSKYKVKVDDSSTKLDTLGGLLRNMEEQRHSILKVTGEWEQIMQNTREKVLDKGKSK